MITKTRIEALESEVEEIKKLLTDEIVTYKEPDYSKSRYSIYSMPMKTVRKATILGKVDAIIEHLGIEIEVIPPKDTPAKVVVKSASTVTKRKYTKSGKYSKKSKE